MEQEIIKIRDAAYKTLHLFFVLYSGPRIYHIVDTETEGSIPVLGDYLSFHYHDSRIRMKDISSNIIYLLTPGQFRNSLLGDMLQNDPALENKVRAWFPFLWGEISDTDASRYSSIIRQLQEIADITS